MLTAQQKNTIDLSLLKERDQLPYKKLYDYFLHPLMSEQEKQVYADAFLSKQIALLKLPSTDFPKHVDELEQWVETHHHATCRKFQCYLQERKAGQPRQYFPNLSAIYLFLLKVAPVKLVDGAWLYRSTAHWQNPAFHDLIITYLEELGLGRPAGNHVCMYQQLIRHLGLHEFQLSLDDAYYHQPVIQLALGYASDHFLPEMIGFNLGYEQLPLHLMITNYELAELGVDSQYFNVHITIDNLDNGHAKRAIRAVQCMQDHSPDWWQRIQTGYMLNDVGLSSTQLIAEFDLGKSIEELMQRKALIGQFVHNNRCEFAQKSINEWLSNPQTVPQLLTLLEEKKWIRRHEAPEQSPFWRMIADEQGKMFGVFNHIEKQLIYDWIAGDLPAKRQYSGRLRYSSDQTESSMQLIQHHADLSRYKTTVDRMEAVRKLMSPAQHFNPEGLAATHYFSQQIFPHLSF